LPKLLYKNTPLQIGVILFEFFECFSLVELSHVHGELEELYDRARHYRIEGRELLLSVINPFRTGADFWPLV
jgi:hypothetical protein